MPVIVLGLCGFAGFVGDANADSLIITDVAISSSGGYTIYTYMLGLTEHSSLFKPSSSAGGNWSADFIEIFDFAGLQGTVQFTPAASSGLAAADFALSTPLTDPLAVSDAMASSQAAANTA